MEFRVLGQLEAWRAGDRLPLGSFKQRSLLALLLDRRQPGDRCGPDHRRALGRRSWPRTTTTRCGCTFPSCAPCSSPTASGGPEAECWRRDLRLCRQRPRRPARLDPLRAPGPGRSRATRRRPGCRRPGPRRSARLVAGSALRGLHLRVVRAGRDPPARRAAPGDGRAEDRCRPAPRPGQRAGRRATGSRPPASVPRALHRPAHAGAPPVGPPSRSAAVLRPPAVHARRRTRTRSLHRAPGARAPDPDVRAGAGPADADECRRPAVGHPGLRAKGADRDERPGADVIAPIRRRRDARSASRSCRRSVPTTSRSSGGCRSIRR